MPGDFGGSGGECTVGPEGNYYPRVCDLSVRLGKQPLLPGSVHIDTPSEPNDSNTLLRRSVQLKRTLPCRTRSRAHSNVPRLRGKLNLREMRGASAWFQSQRARPWTSTLRCTTRTQTSPTTSSGTATTTTMYRVQATQGGMGVGGDPRRGIYHGL